ncbi:hypothetical protein [Sodalis sp. RH16]|uniref:hypothetical protein n=1 Tax=Sodalis sp. RH16 TaxID=3394331 RepID=UPI0039B565D1
MIPCIQATSAAHHTIFNNQSETQKIADIGFIRVKNVLIELTLIAPQIIEKIFFYLGKDDYTNLRESILSDNIEPPMRAYGELERSLQEGNYDIKSLKPKERGFYHELLVKPDNDSASVIALLNEKLAVGNNIHKDFFSGRSHKEIMIAFPSFSDENIFPRLHNLLYKINTGLHAMEPSKTIVFQQGPDPTYRFKAIDKLIFPRNLFNEQITAHKSLRCILEAADSIIKTQSGNARFMCALSIHHLLDCLKNEKLSSLTSETIDAVSQEFPYIANLGKALVTLYPELQTNKENNAKA